MPVGPFAVSDEVNLQLMLAIMSEDPNLTTHEIQLKNTLINIIKVHRRTGEKKGQGFYDYPNNEKKNNLEIMGNYLSTPSQF